MANVRALKSFDVLQLVFQFAGLSQRLFQGGMCRNWAAAMLERRAHDDTTTVAAAAAQATTTRLSAVAESVSRITYVCKWDKSFKTRQRLLALSTAAASHGCSDALRWCEVKASRRVWRKWHQDLVLAAVGGNQFVTVQQLLGPSLKAHWDVAFVAKCAARSKRSDMAMLQWSLNLRSDWVPCDVAGILLQLQ
jgi:hypothetical protein